MKEIQNPKKISEIKMRSRSNPKMLHTIETYESGDQVCSCPAGEQQKFCYHEQRAWLILKATVKRIELKHPQKCSEILSEMRASKGGRKTS